MNQSSKSLGNVYALSKLFTCDEIKLCAWSGNKKQEVLVVYMTSGDFIFYNFIIGEDPIVKHVPWFSDPLHTPVSLDFSPSGGFLLVLSESCHLYVIPVLPLFDSTYKSELNLDPTDLTIHTYPFASKAPNQTKSKSKSPNSTHSVISSLSLQSGSSTSSLNDKQRSSSSSSSSFVDSQGNENVIKLKEILSTKNEVSPSVVGWWHSINNHQEIGVIAMKSGEIIFVDLITGLKVGEASVKGEVKALSVCQDKTLDSVFLLVTIGNDDQFKLTLEQRHINYILPGKQNSNGNEDSDIVDGQSSGSNNGNYLPSARARLQGLKQMSAEKLASLKHKIAETRSKIGVRQDDSSSKCYGPPLENLGAIVGDTLISPQYSHDEVVLAGYHAQSQLLTVHSMNLAVVPLFIHKMPVETEDVLLCDRVIYLIANNRTTIEVISSKLSETWIEPSNDFNPESVLGKWDLKSVNETDEQGRKSEDCKITNSAKPDLIPEDLPTGNEERILKVYRSVGKAEDYDIAKMYKLEKTKEELPDFPKSENCVVVTNRGVYVIELKSNVVKVAMDMILETQELEKAERVCTIYGINLQKLLELAGDVKLAGLEFPMAIALYKLSKCGLLKSIVKLACGNHCSQVLNYSTMLMANSISDMSLTERIHLSNLILMAYTQQILKNEHNRILMTKFLEFLQTNSYFDAVLAVSVTGQSLLFSCLHQLITYKGLILDGYNVVIKLMERFINSKVLDWSLNKNEFWKCATDANLIEAMVIRSSSFPAYANYLSQHLEEVEPMYLERLLKVLDPTAPCIRPVTRIFKTSEDSFDSDETQAAFPFGKLIELFLLVLLIKLHKSRNGEEDFDRKCLLPSQEVNDGDNLSGLTEAESFNCGESLSDEIWPIRKDMQVADNEKFKKRSETILSCGFGHTALIRNGSVYTWGQTAKGCLGQGPTMTRYSPPGPITWLSSFKLEVSIVSCGKYHTAALTNNGVYTWGCSKYGQLGLGNIYESPHPRLVQTLANEDVITLSCGQFHTLALTNQGSVFAWGWGVHGQLGLGTIDDHRVPIYIHTLKEHSIVGIAAGHGHSLVLSDKGHVYSFGSSVFGQLGSGTTVKNSLPSLVKGINGKVTSIATGYFHNLALTEANTLYTWGMSPQCLRFQAQARKRSRLLQNQNSGASSSDLETPKSTNEECSERAPEEVSEGNGVLDKAGSEVHLSPSLIDTSNVVGKIVQMSCGCHHSALITDSGGVYTWGRSIDGQLGNGEHREIQIPTQINANGFKADCVSCGCEFTAAQEKHTGKIYCWGSNAVGQLAIPVKESATKSLDGKLVMLKSCKRIVRLLDRNTGSNSVDTPKEIPEIPPPTFTYHTLTKHINSKARNLSDFDPEYSQRSLHFVIENFTHFINLTDILKRCLEYCNYQAASKIALLQNQCKQSIIYQLKALQNLPKYHSKSASHSAKDDSKTPGSPESEIHLFTVQGGHEDMCDDSRVREELKLLDDDSVEQNVKTKQEESLPSSESREGTNLNRFQMEYIDHAKYILEAYLNLNSSHLYEESDNCSILETGIQFWAAEKLPMVALENFFLGKLDEIFYDFGYLLFCQQPKDNQTPFFELFSTSFLFTVVSKILTRIENNQSCAEYLETMSKMLTKDKSEGNATPQTKTRSARRKELESQEVHLEDIEENLKQQWVDKDFIKISCGDIIGGSVYFFSCGHHHSAKSLKEECKIFEEINDGALMSKLLKFYKILDSEKQSDLACPLCVRNYLRQ